MLKLKTFRKAFVPGWLCLCITLTNGGRSNAHGQ